MGLFSFIKDAGAKIFGGKTTDEKKDDAIDKLKSTVKKLDLKVSDLKIELDDDKAMVWGEATDQATKEKVVLVIGNSEGIAKVDDKMTVAPMPEEEDCEPVRESRFHTVKSGDTLSKVAKEVYGDAMKYPIIFEANKPMLTYPDKIYPGQVLRVPYLDEVEKVK